MIELRNYQDKSFAALGQTTTKEFIQIVIIMNKYRFVSSSGPPLLKCMRLQPQQIVHGSAQQAVRFRLHREGAAHRTTHPSPILELLIQML